MVPLQFLKSRKRVVNHQTYLCSNNQSRMTIKKYDRRMVAIISMQAILLSAVLPKVKGGIALLMAIKLPASL